MKLLAGRRFALLFGAFFLLFCLFYCTENSAWAKSLNNLFLTEPAVRQPQAPDGKTAEDREAPRQVLVKFKEGADRQTVQTVEAEFGLRSVKMIAGSNVVVMEVMGDDSVAEIVERLKGTDSVEHAEPNYFRSIR